jgi:hypothetical protein
VRVRAAFVHASKREHLAAAEARAPKPQPGSSAAAPVVASTGDKTTNACALKKPKDGSEIGDGGEGESGGGKSEGVGKDQEGRLEVLEGPAEEDLEGRGGVTEEMTSPSSFDPALPGKERELEAAVQRFQLLLTKVDDGSASFTETVELERVCETISELRKPREPPPPPKAPSLPPRVR